MATTVQPLDERAGAQAAAIYRDGMVGLPGLFSSDWADRLLEDFEAAFADARSHPQGTVGRGPNRYYFAVHPERVRGFAELVTHPRICALCEQVLGPDYQIVELGFDVPMAGAVDQPWHRDFLMPPETVKYGRLSSLAFNLTTVDVTPDLAPLEIALGTQFDDGDAFDHGMFPRAEDYPRLAVSGSIVLLFASLGMVVYYADHLAHSIQVDAIAKRVELSTLKVVHGRLGSVQEPAPTRPRGRCR
jgi:hypothetical protein